MKRALLTVVFAGSAALAASGAAGGQLPTLPRDVPMAGAGFPGAPPAFEIPHGGKVEIVEGGTDERTFILRRADGTRFAEARVIRGRTRTALFYNEVGTLTLATHALWPDESRLNLRRISASGAGPGRRAAYCSPDDRYNGHYWKINAGVTFKWYFVSGSTPSGMSVDTTETYLRNGHAEWYNNTNHCDVGDYSSFLMGYGGRIASSFGSNGINTVGFGNGSEIGCGGMVACTRNDVNANNINQESDTRFNSAEFSFINGGASGKYDTWGVMAHELGHTLGCADQAYTDANVMYYTGSTNDTSDQKLGRGDAKCNNDKY